MSLVPRFATRVARVGRLPLSGTRPLAPPIHVASVYLFEDLAQVDAVWEGQEAGYVYGRFGTPNHTQLEETLASLEGAETAVVAASGMGALTALLQAALRPGEGLVAGHDLYGTTAALLRHDVPRWGIAVAFADGCDAGAVEAALAPGTRAILVEAVSNPLLRVADLEGLADLARRRDLALLVDATFLSPALFRPLEHGATAVHHSATKYLAGHGDATAGVVAGPRRLVEAVRAHVVRLGLNLGAFDAWLVLRGVRTLALRVARQSANALTLARFLEGHPRVERVHYPGLESHPHHGRAARLFREGFGGVLAFELVGGERAVARFFQAARPIEFAPSFGDVTTTWTYPARTSHRPLSDEERAQAGIGRGLVRLSVGIEDVEDLKETLATALAATG